MKKKMGAQDKIDQAVQMSCQRRAELDDWETQTLYDYWLASRQNQLKMADIAIIAVASMFLCIIIGFAYSIHTGDWAWVDGPMIRT